MSDVLDEVLSKSAPTWETDPKLDLILADLVAATRSPRRGGPRKPRRGVLLGTTTAGIVLAGSAAAAAVGVAGWTSPWAQDPDGSITFSLPTGGECELRIGNLYSDNREATHELREWLDDRTLREIADVDSALAEIRAEESTWVRNDGSTVRVGYGTQYYDADAEYVDAVMRAVGAALTPKLESFGLPAGQGAAAGHEGELHCTGSNPSPSVPRYMR